MRWKSLAFLVVVVAVLSYVSRQRASRLDEGVGIAPARFSLVPGFAPERVQSVRIDNVERAVQVRLERDAGGNWFLTDPIAYPALHGVLQALFRTLGSDLGEPAGELDLAQAGLDPPRVVLELKQASAAGDETPDGRYTYRIEVGGVDLDSDQVYVRVHEHPASEDGEPIVMRATRALHNTLDRNPDDYRDDHATRLRGIRIREFRRSGSVFVSDRAETIELDLHARVEGSAWRKLDAPSVRLDPNAIGLLARAAAELRVLSFVDDSPSGFDEYGLDPALFQVELTDAGGERAVLHFGFPMRGPGVQWSDVWYCRREGFPHVWQVEDRDVALLSRPADELYDYFLVRAERDDVLQVELRAHGRRLTIGREDGTWLLRVDAEDTAMPAAAGPVQDLLAAVETSELRYPRGVEWVPEEPPMSITVTTRDGVRWGGDVGTPWRDAESGLAGRRFRRFGDELVGVLEERVAELLGERVEAFRSMQIHRIRPEDVRSVVLEYDGRRFAYVHPDEERWLVEGDDFDAPSDFVGTTVHLFSLRARRWLEGFDAASLERRMDVTIASRAGDAIELSLGRDAAGELVCVERGLAALVETDAQRALFGVDLGEKLEALFR